MTNLPPGFGGDPYGYGGASQYPGLINQVMQQPFVGADMNLLAGQESFTDAQAQQSYGNAMGRLGIQRGALGREQTALPQEHALSNQLLGLSRQDLDLQRQQMGIRGKSLDITETGERQAADVATRGAWSGATARGATNTSGFRQGLGDIGNSLAQQLAQLGLSRQGLGLQGQGLDIQGQRLGINQQQSDINYGLQQGSLADQLAGLGISQTEIGQQLANSQQGAALNRATGAINVAQGAYGNAAAGAQAVPGGIVGASPPNYSPYVAPAVGGPNNTPGGAGPVYRPGG